MAPTFGHNTWIHASFLHDFLPQGLLDIFCSFHVSWQHVGSDKAFSHLGIPSRFSAGARSQMTGLSK